MALSAMPERVGARDAVLFYDGLCGFCDGLVRWFLRRRHGRIYFAAQQSEMAQFIFARHSLVVGQGSTVYLLVQPGTDRERMLERSDAVLCALSMLGGVWRLVAGLLRVLPRGLRDAVYAAVARNRYRIAGRRTECRVPTAEERERFLS